MPRRRTLIVACLAALALPAPALAAGTTIAPPGNSGANQYFETVPSAGGNATPPAAGAPHSHSVVPSKDAQRLARLGKQGAAAAALAAAGAPPAPRKGSAPVLTPRHPLPTGSAPGSSIARAVTGSGSGGLGVVLPIVLAGTLVAALAVVLVRRLRRGPAL